MNAFRTELYKVSFDDGFVTITAHADESYEDFDVIEQVARFVQNNSHMLSSREAIKIMSKTTEYLFDI